MAATRIRKTAQQTDETAKQGKTIRLATVEYQPNLQRPVDSYRLGVLVEDGSGHDRRVLLVGRRSLEGLDLGELWGPFRHVVTNWFEEISRNIDELMKTAGSASVIDQLGRQWHANLYVREPEEIRLTGPEVSIDRTAMTYYEQAIGESVSLANVHKRTAARDMVPA